MKKNRKINKILFLLYFLLLGIFIVSCQMNEENQWDALGGGGSGEIQNNADTNETDKLEDKSNEIIENIEEEQKNTETEEVVEVIEPLVIEEPGDYKLSGTIIGQISIKALNVRLFLDDCNLTNPSGKVISSDYDFIIILVDNTNNIIDNTNRENIEANAISSSGKITINGSGQLSIYSSKSGVKANKEFYGLGGSLTISAKTGHAISADSCILMGISIVVNQAQKDAIHAETDDEVLQEDPSFDASRGYVYISEGTNIVIKNIYGDGISSDTYTLIDGGNIEIHTLPTFVKAKNSSSCYKLSGGVYTKVAAEDSAKNYSNLYQLDQSCKGIKVGEIDYEIDDVEYVILEETAYALIINNAVINISTTDDCLHTNSGNILINGGDITLSTSDDAIGCDNNLKITGGNINILNSYEGLEAETIDIMDGVITLRAIDDGINASSDKTTALQKITCYIKINGGTIYVDSGGDGVDSNGGVQISGGQLYINGPTSGMDAALDSETGIIITGGIVIALGSSGMVETPASNSSVYCVSINLSKKTSGDVVVKENNETLISFSPQDIFNNIKEYQSLVIVCPQFELNKTYTVESGSTSTSVKISGIITKVGQTAGPGKR